ncbi:hypothetical protein MRX96_038590 [Rhipicephalus microplus]
MQNDLTRCKVSLCWLARRARLPNVLSKHSVFGNDRDEWRDRPPDSGEEKQRGGGREHKTTRLSSSSAGSVERGHTTEELARHSGLHLPSVCTTGRYLRVVVDKTAAAASGRGSVPALAAIRQCVCVCTLCTPGTREITGRPPLRIVHRLHRDARASARRAVTESDDDQQRHAVAWVQQLRQGLVQARQGPSGEATDTAVSAPMRRRAQVSDLSRPG